MNLKEIIKCSGASVPQMVHWTRQGWLPSGIVESGSGNHRHYTDADAVAAKLAVDAVNEYGSSAARAVLRRFKAALIAQP